MSQPAFYPGKTDKVEVESTHISIVFLAGDLVWKIKKPLNLGFLDFSSLEKRRYFCGREVELNRRLAPEVYLGAVPIFQDPGGRFSLDPPGAVVEYAVKMRRLDSQGMFPVLAARGRLSPGVLEELAKTLADFHAKARTGGEVDEAGSPQALARMWEEDLAQTRGRFPRFLEPELLDLLEAFARNTLRDKAALFENRVARGRIRACHGDLHLANICLDRGRVVIFDCIEFNDRFRFMDVASEAAFLAMDLEKAGQWGLSRHFTQTYGGFSGDAELDQLLPFYKCHRALVRAKVLGLRTRKEERPALEYARLAARYAAQPPHPALICMAGVTGSGKSALARDLADLTGASLLVSDVERKALAGMTPETRSNDAYGKGIYSRDATEMVYALLVEKAAAALEKGESVILDASFMRAVHRAKAREAAKTHGAPFWLIWCQAPDDQAISRLEHRAKDPDAVSDGRVSIWRSQKEDFEPPGEIPLEQRSFVLTARPPLALACAALQSRMQ